MIRALAVAMIACAALAGCGAGQPAPSETASAYFELLIARATTAGADDQQMATLRSASTDGGVTYEEVDALMSDFFSCARDAGLAPQRLPDKPIAPGVKAPDYEVGFGSFGADQGDALTQACLTKTVDFAMEALHQQPSSVEAMDKDIMDHRTEIAACTATHGYPLADDANLDEIRVAVQGTLIDTQVMCYNYTG